MEYTARRWLVLAVMMIGLLSLLGRALDLQLRERDFLLGQGDARHQRIMPIPAHRGMILDRNGEPLAISTPVDSVWANPRETLAVRARLPTLAKLLGMSDDALLSELETRAEKEFVYLKRGIDPDAAKKVMALNIPGINLQREYRRYYPLGEVISHVLGFTNIDDAGQEGLELAYDHWLSGIPGAKQVIKDRLGRIVEDLELIRAGRAGKDLRLSLDRRIQYLAYRELKVTVMRHYARSGSVVVLDPNTGEVLAMANQPSFNPNNRLSLREDWTRNRAVTDVLEPGSTVKPFVIAAAIDSGRFDLNSIIQTSPGWYMVNGHTIQDEHDYGRLHLAGIIRKSSNVGATKIALALPPGALWRSYDRVGFGALTGSGFPGEALGSLSDYHGWGAFERATLAFGYGLAVTPLQLARAYAAIAADGLLPTISFTPVTQTERTRVMSVSLARELRHMLEGVVSVDGTAPMAAVDGYRVAGKTGTVHIPTAGGYAKRRYISVFVGMAPARQPALVTVVVIEEPQGDVYYGGQVAAPVFSRIMDGALRLLDVRPDNLPQLQANTPRLQVAPNDA
ncbi:MAG TPA: penicillin-binding transpeptidase domain-containing protein [Gammaproteobacteria bacterium]|nr:penicillin-binding transpeptidase domain-containing protein [Gammaproteobacteria bacterium]